MRSTWAGILASIFIDPNLQWNYDALPRPVDSYKWHSQLFELFFVWSPTLHYIIGVTRNNIDSRARIEHHSITGDWEVYMGKHLAIDFHRSQPPDRSWNEFLNQFRGPRGSSHRKTRSVTNLLGCGHKHPGRSQSLGILASLFIDPNLQWNYDATPRPVGPFRWHSQLFELFYAW